MVLDASNGIGWLKWLIAAYQQEKRSPHGVRARLVCLFSLKLQNVVAEAWGLVMYMDAKTGRSVDIRVLGGGWLKLYDGWVKSRNVRGR